MNLRKCFAAIVIISMLTISACGQKADLSVSESINTSSEKEDNSPVEASEGLDAHRDYSDIVKTGDVDLDRAIWLGIATEEDLKEDRVLKCSEAFNIVYTAIELISPEAARSFSKQLAGLRVRTTAINRFEGMILLQKAGKALGDEYFYITSFVTACNELNSMGWEAVYQGVHVASEFGDQEYWEMYDEVWGTYEYAVLYALGRYDIYTGQSLFDRDEKEWLRVPDDLTCHELVRAAVRLYDSVGGTGADDFICTYNGGKADSFTIMINGEPAGTVPAKKENGEWMILYSDAETIFKDASVQTGEEYICLRDIAQTLDYSFEPDDKLESAYYWTNIKYAESPEIPAYLINGNRERQKKYSYKAEELHTQMIPVSDERVMAPDKDILTDELLAYANERAASQTSMEKKSGFVLPTINWQTHKIDVTEQEIRIIANWGFNAVRIILDWQDFFDHDMTEIDYDELQTLDMLVASAIKYDIYMDLQFLKEPGRWHTEGEGAEGGDYELDLYVNEENQEKCEKLWRLFARRYKEVPGRNLSFSPLWEPLNYRLSSTHLAPEYGVSDVNAVFIRLANAIHEESPERLIVFEPVDLLKSDYYIKAASDPTDQLNTVFFDTVAAIEAAGVTNVEYDANYCSMPYVYGEMLPDVIEDVGDVNVDTMVHSMFKPEYPVTIYGANKLITPGIPMTIDGFLPAGTRITVYAREASGTVSFTADGERLYEETFGKRTTFKKDVLLSMYYTYAESEHPIDITLEKETGELKIESNDSFEWSGIKVTLPEEFGVERWFYYSTYDNVLENGNAQKPISEKLMTSEILISPNLEGEGSHLTVNQDVSFVSDAVLNESTKESINSFIDLVAEQEVFSTVRFENDIFNLGTTYESELRYYEDILTAFDNCGLGWCSNDYDYMIGHTFGKLAGIPRGYYYAGYSEFNYGLLKLLQKHQ